jgi:hypothetical protein
VAAGPAAAPLQQARWGRAGAAVGFGFAAVERAGDAFTAVFTAGGPLLLCWGRLALDALLGLLILRNRWPQATAPERAATPIALPLVIGGGRQG